MACVVSSFRNVSKSDVSAEEPEPVDGLNSDDVVVPPDDVTGVVIALNSHIQPGSTQVQRLWGLRINGVIRAALGKRPGATGLVMS